MPKSKNRANHKKKVAVRKTNISNENAKQKKFQKEFIENLIKQEQEKGAFENTQSIDFLQNGPIINGPTL